MGCQLLFLIIRSMPQVPILFFVTSKLTCLLRNQVGKTRAVRICGDILINCFVLLAVILLFVAMLYLEVQIIGFLLALAVYDVIIFVVAILIFNCFPVKLSL